MSTGTITSQRRSLDRSWLASIALTLPLAALFLWSTHTGDWESARAVVVVVVIATLGGLVLRRLAARQPDGLVVKIILFGGALKLVASVLRYLVAFEVYDGVADATGYASWGERLATQFRQLEFFVPFDLIGTGFIRVVTGVVFTFTGATTLGGFFVFAVFGFIGQYLAFRALQIARPDAGMRRYAVLVFLLPSMLYWPSSIGKETWMMLGIGLVAYGAALLFTQRRGSIVAIIAGFTALTMVRPHMALLLGVGLAAGLLVQQGASAKSSARRAQSSLLLIVALGALAILASQASTFFGVESLSTDSLTGILDDVAVSTSQGGSQFQSASPSRPWLYPVAIFSVLFRPLPFEANNPQMLLASLEGLALLFLSWRWRHDIRRGLRQARSDPYLAFAGTYSALFLLAFSSFGNFGILARQRSLLFPLFMVFAAAVPARPHDDAPGASPTPSPPLWQPDARGE